MKLTREYAGAYSFRINGTLFHVTQTTTGEWAVYQADLKGETSYFARLADARVWIDRLAQAAQAAQDEMADARPDDLTEASWALLKRIAAGDNYGGERPLRYFAPGDLSDAERGNLTDLKRKGYVEWTEPDDDYPGNYFVQLSDRAEEVAR